MMLKNSVDNWGLVARLFHWLIALLILIQFILGRIADALPISPRKLDLFVAHKSIGISILLLVGLRIVWRLANALPQPLATGRWERRLAAAGHALLYALMLAVPLTGWWVSDTSRIPFKLFWSIPVPDFMAANRQMSELAGEIHEFLTTTLLVVIVLHVLAALRHHYVLRNDTLRRMLPIRRTGSL